MALAVSMSCSTVGCRARARGRPCSSGYCSRRVRHLLTVFELVLQRASGRGGGGRAVIDGDRSVKARGHIRRGAWLDEIDAAQTFHTECSGWSAKSERAAGGDSGGERPLVGCLGFRV